MIKRTWGVSVGGAMGKIKAVLVDLSGTLHVDDSPIPGAVDALNMGVSVGGAMGKIKAVLVDLSGTLHVDDSPIPGAVDALNILQKQEGLKIRFVTNTTKECKRVLVARLHKMGFSMGEGEEEVFTSLSAARKLVESRRLRPLLMLDKAAMEDFHGVPQEDPNAVVMGLAPEEMNYHKMNVAMRLIQEKGAPLIAIHKARYFRRSDGLALGPGPFVTALEFATGVQSEVVGKPSREFFLSSIAGLGCEPQDCVMVGDDARDDIQGAQAVGMKGILVQTGKYRAGDEDTIDPRPHCVVPSFKEAVDHLLSLS